MPPCSCTLAAWWKRLYDDTVKANKKINLWPLELQLPPAHPPATHRMASTLCSPSSCATSVVTCTKTRETHESLRGKKASEGQVAGVQAVMQDYMQCAVINFFKLRRLGGGGGARGRSEMHVCIKTYTQEVEKQLQYDKYRVVAIPLKTFKYYIFFLNVT